MSHTVNDSRKSQLDDETVESHALPPSSPTSEGDESLFYVVRDGDSGDEGLSYKATVEDVEDEDTNIGGLSSHPREGIRETQLDDEWLHYKATVEEVEDEDANIGLGDGPDILLEDLTRPSEYLRSRCPLCFGGINWHDPDSL